MRTKTEQELFWEGEFGDDYTGRVLIDPTARQPFFANILAKTCDIQTVCELGANRGHNLQAIYNLNSDLKLTGVELNSSAVVELAQVPGVEVIHSSIQAFQPARTFDLVFTCGVLIHISPDDLPQVYQQIYQLANRYILINEYYNPKPVEIDYRGHSRKLFKRDFAGELIDQMGGTLKVIDYGFLWRRLEPAWDDTTWVLLKKTDA